MNSKNLKRKIAATLCVATLLSACAPAGLASAEIVQIASNGEADPQPATPIKADITPYEDTLTVKLTSADDRDLYIALGEDEDNLVIIKKGEKKEYVYEGLAAGAYDLEIDYVEKPFSAFKATVNVDGKPVVIPPTPTPTPVETPTTPPAATPTPPLVEALTPTPTPVETPTPTPTATPVGPLQFEITPILSDGGLSVNITNASDWELEAKLLDANGNQVGQTVSRLGSGLVSLGKLGVGAYTVVVGYVTPADGVSARQAAVVVAEGATPEPVQPTVTQLEAKVETGSDYMIVTVTRADNFPLYIAVGNMEPRLVDNGGSARFDNLVPGKYDVEVDYVTAVPGVSPFRTSVEIASKPVLAPIAISQIVGSENQLIVTGTAQPGSDITLTTEPSSGTNIVHVDAAGSFTAALVCSAGTYTSVSAQYGSDSASLVMVKGSFVVTAPAQKPTLTVDPIYVSSSTVLAKTTPGTLVNLGAYDYGQTLTADANGLLRFSLPHYYAVGDQITFTVYYGKDNKESFKQVQRVVNAVNYPLLKTGSKGDAVYTLTARLAELGYPVSATSKYDATVAAAVRLFQNANGLQVDGMAGKLTQTALYSLSAIAYGNSGSYYPTLVRGDRGLALIYTLQQRLKDLGYYTIRVDGIYGSGTQRAVRWFQQVNGLSDTGKADDATQKLLYSSSAKPASGYAPGDSYTTLSRSNRYNSAVVTLQRRLKELGYLTSSVDGYFGSKTYRAVRSFQSRNGITVTGVADSYTQQVLYSSGAKAASGAASSSGTSTGYRLLYWGCKGDAVKKLQSALLDAGYKQVRTADGIFGQWTYDAVRAYQKDHGLSVDGIAGKNTQNSLYGTSY